MDQPRQSLLDPEMLRGLFRRLAATDIDELEIRHGSSRLFVRRDFGADLGHRSLTLGSAPAVQGSDRTAHRPGTAAQTQQGVPVIAPLTGVLYTRPSPEQPPFVNVGDLVEAGQVIALIETMKLFNEVAADLAGEVMALAAHDGELVQAGAPLIYLRPDAESEEQ